MHWNRKLLLVLAGFALFGMLIPSAVCAGDNYRVVMIIRNNDGTVGHDFYAHHLISVTANGVEDIATLRGQEMFGSDDETIAIRSGGHLLVLNRQKLTVIADVIMTNTYPVVPVTSPDENLAVDSKQGKVYIPVFVQDPYSPSSYYSSSYYASRHSVAVLEVDWRNGDTVLLAVPGSYYRVISLPNAVGVEDGELIAIYRQRDSEREAGRSWPLLRFADATPDKIYPFQTGFSDYYYVPDLGLFKSRANKTQFQVTDKNLSTNDISPLQIVISNSPGSTAFDYDGKFFVRNINGKPHWIWGENDGGTNAWGITKIVMMNMESGKETLRKSLNAQVWPRFIPNADASKVYFFDPAAVQI